MNTFAKAMLSPKNEEDGAQRMKKMVLSGPLITLYIIVTVVVNNDNMINIMMMI